MAAGDLSPDQARFVATLAELTGLDAGVVRAWVGAASGWHRTRPDHAYLGPRGQTFRSAEEAARRVASLIDATELRHARQFGPLVQLRELGQARQWPGTVGQITQAWAEAAWVDTLDPAAPRVGSPPAPSTPAGRAVASSSGRQLSAGDERRVG